MLRYYVTKEGKIGSKYKDMDNEQVAVAEFSDNGDQTVTLLRWPRLKREAYLPKMVEDKKLTIVAATAFASEHIDEKLFSELYETGMGYSMFCMMHDRQIARENIDEGGPVQVWIPDSIEQIGEYAFWRCRNLKKVIFEGAVQTIPAGVFGECSNLECINLKEGLRKIGYMPPAGRQSMPDLGTFAGCHSLKKIILPASVTEIGVYSFNSAGLVVLEAVDKEGGSWKRKIKIHETAFEHTASLLWMDKVTETEKIQYRIALPQGRDRILQIDDTFGIIQRIPYDFFRQSVTWFDKLAQRAFRLDFSARMALGRLQYDMQLTEEDRKWYLQLLVDYFECAGQFMPEEEDAFSKLFDFLEHNKDLEGGHISSILRKAGTAGISVELCSHMLEVRNARFADITGFEELELDT